MKIYVFLIMLIFFIGCTEEDKEIDSSNEEISNEPIIVPPTGNVIQEISEEERLRIVNNSYQVILSKNQTVVGGGENNLIKIMIVPQQDFTVEIDESRNGLNSLGEIVIDPISKTPGTYFKPGEYSGSVTLIISNGEILKRVPISINGELSFVENATVANEGENNVIELQTIGGAGDVSFSLLSSEEVGRIEGNRYFPPDSDEFINIFNDMNSGEDYQFFYNVAVVAIDSNGNSTIGSIKVYPKMQTTLRQNNTNLNLDNYPDLVCTEQRGQIGDRNKLYLNLVGGMPPFEILNTKGFEISESQNGFVIEPPYNCNGTSVETLNLVDKMGNERQINIRLIANLAVSQNIENRVNTETSYVTSNDSDIDIESTTEREATEDFILTIIGGKEPFSLYKNGIKLNMENIAENQYKVVSDLIGSSNSMRLMDAYSNYSDIFLSQDVAQATYISPYNLDYNNPFQMFEAYPGDSVIEGTNDCTLNFDIGSSLNLFTGKKYNLYSDDYRGKSFYILRRYSSRDSFYEQFSEQGFQDCTFVVKDRLGTTFNISKKSYLPYKFSYKKYNQENFSNILVDTYGNRNQTILDMNLTSENYYINNFLSSYKSYLSINKHKILPNIFWGQENYDVVKIGGGYNGHRLSESITYEDSSGNSVETNPVFFDIEKKVCWEDLGSGYGRFSKGLKRERLHERETSDFNFKASYSGILRQINTNIKDNFNTDLRRRSFGTERYNQLFTFNRRISPSSNNYHKLDRSIFQDRFNLVNNYYSHVLSQNVYLGGSFEFRKRPLSLYSGAQNIQVSYNYERDGIIRFEVPENNLVCQSFNEFYGNVDNSSEDVPDEQFEKINIEEIELIGEGLQYYEEYDAICTSGHSLKYNYFIGDDGVMKYLKYISGINKSLSLLSFYEVTIDSEGNQVNDNQLYNSLYYKLLSVGIDFRNSTTYRQFIIGTNFSHDFQDGLNCSQNPQNKNIGIYTSDDNSIISKRLFNYFPDEQLLEKFKFSLLSWGSFEDDFLIPAFKKNSDCTKGERILLKIPFSGGAVEEINLNERIVRLIGDRQIDISDIKIRKVRDSDSELYDIVIFLTGLTPSLAGANSTVDVPFVIGLSYSEEKDDWVEIFDRRNSLCDSPLSISAPYFDSVYKTNVAIMFNVSGSYLKGGSILTGISNSSTQDIGRIEFNNKNGDLLFFRRYQSLNEVKSYESVGAFTSAYRGLYNIHFIKEITDEGAKFYSIRYHNFLRFRDNYR